MELIQFYFRKSNFEINMMLKPDHLKEKKLKDWKEHNWFLHVTALLSCTLILRIILKFL
jgi:hypothetical protein